MTTCATRAPLQVSSTTRHNMPDPPRSTRRSSTRLAEKEDGAGEQTGKAGAGRGKRKLDYDEEDDGFTFKRTKAKRTRPGRPSKAELAAQEEAEPAAADTATATARAPSRKKTVEHKASASPPAAPLVVPKARKAKRDGGQQQQQQLARERTPEAVGPTKIALPFADTPVMRRNKEMRKGGGDGSSRRSSLKMRGRRASSLIESGTSNALPHAGVDSAEFYKHIESVLPEPRRMKQLLTWCGTRAMGDKPSGRNHAALAAREIQQQLLNEFSTRSELSDWFAREDSTTARTVPLKPNPKNVANQARIQELEQQLARLKAERARWEELLSPPSDSSSSKPPAFPTPSAPLDPATLPAATSLAGSDARSIATLQPAPPASAPPREEKQPHDQKQQPQITKPTPPLDPAPRLAAALAAAEFEADKLVDGAHVLAEFVRNADAAGRFVLRGCAAALDERGRTSDDAAKSGGSDGGDGSAAAGRDGGEGSGSGGLGPRDVLRALSRVVER